jgi:DnaJ-class molecular chaperone
VHIVQKSEEWVKCGACSGTGSRQKAGPELLDRLQNMDISRTDRARLIQGVCIACGGKGQSLKRTRIYMDRVGFVTWLKAVLF